MKILIAEDEPISAKILRVSLEMLDHEVVIARDGAEAWERFDRDPFRIVVSDWMMPELDGLELCQKIRRRPATPYTYFILLTSAHTGADDYTHAMDSDVDDFLTKPLNREMLRTRLHVAQRILRFTTEITALQDLIPICSYCKKIHDRGDYWERVETYVRKRTGRNFTHGICPECYDKQMLNLVKQTEEGVIDELTHCVAGVCNYKAE